MVYPLLVVGLIFHRCSGFRECVETTGFKHLIPCGRRAVKFAIPMFVYLIVRKITLGDIDGATVLVALAGVCANECSHIGRNIQVHTSDRCDMQTLWRYLMSFWPAVWIPFLPTLIMSTRSAPFIPIFIAFVAYMLGGAGSAQKKDLRLIWYYWIVSIIAGCVFVISAKGYDHNSRIGGPLLVIMPLLLSGIRMLKWLNETWHDFLKLLDKSDKKDAYYSVSQAVDTVSGA